MTHVIHSQAMHPFMQHQCHPCKDGGALVWDVPLPRLKCHSVSPPRSRYLASTPSIPSRLSGLPPLPLGFESRPYPPHPTHPRRGIPSSHPSRSSALVLPAFLPLRTPVSRHLHPPVPPPFRSDGRSGSKGTSFPFHPRFEPDRLGHVDATRRRHFACDTCVDVHCRRTWDVSCHEETCKMFVVKRDGRKEPVHFDKITARITKLSYGLNTEFCDPVRVLVHHRSRCGKQDEGARGEASRRLEADERGRERGRAADGRSWWRRKSPRECTKGSPPPNWMNWRQKQQLP